MLVRASLLVLDSELPWLLAPACIVQADEKRLLRHVKVLLHFLLLQFSKAIADPELDAVPLGTVLN
jgi:hypothetical protein